MGCSFCLGVDESKQEEVMKALRVYLGKKKQKYFKDALTSRKWIYWDLIDA